MKENVSPENSFLLPSARPLVLPGRKEAGPPISLLVFDCPQAETSLWTSLLLNAPFLEGTPCN